MGSSDSFVEEREVSRPEKNRSQRVRNLDNVVVDFESSNSINFATDCVGKILEHIISSKDLLSIKLTCKVIYHYITKEYPGCCRNVRFTIKMKPKTPQPNCHRMDLDRGNFRIDDTEEFTNDDFKHFPNLTRLYIKGVKLNNLSNCLITSDCFKYLPKLIDLSIDNIPSVKDEDFQYLPNLRKLSLRLQNTSILPPHIMNNIDTHKDKEMYLKRSCPNGSFLKHLPNLEVLKLSSIKDAIRNTAFHSHPPKKLRKLVLWRTRGLKIDFFEHLKCLEHLEMKGCEGSLGNIWIDPDQKLREEFLKTQFGYLFEKSNMAVLMIENCMGFGESDTQYYSSEKFVREECIPKEVLEKEDFKFTYKPKRMLPGGLRPMRFFN